MRSSASTWPFDLSAATTNASAAPTLELTETALLRDTAATMHLLAELKQLGVHLALDDFGTGYSSLSYLRRFPVDAVKIDRSFIEDVGKGPEESALPDAVVALCQAFRIESVAEGIERRSQLTHLQAVGCHAGQGFYFSRPLPPEAVEWEELLPRRPALAPPQPSPTVQPNGQRADATKWGAPTWDPRHGGTATRSTNVTTEQPSAADYGLTLPSEAEVIAELMKLVGADVAIFAWREAAAPDGDGASPGNPEEPLLRIAEQLAARPDVAGVFGRSLAVRVNTYIALSPARSSS